jgi:hypothetical protein
MWRLLLLAACCPQRPTVAAVLCLKTFINSCPALTAYSTGCCALCPLAWATQLHHPHKPLMKQRLLLGPQGTLRCGTWGRWCMTSVPRTTQGRLGG